MDPKWTVVKELYDREHLRYQGMLDRGKMVIGLAGLLLAAIFLKGDRRVVSNRSDDQGLEGSLVAFFFAPSHRFAL